MISLKPLARLALGTAFAVSIAPAMAVDLTAVPSGSYEVEPTHAYINFQYNHLGLSNPTLSFDDFKVDLNLDTNDPTKSMVMVTIDPSSIIAGSDIWKEHLTGTDFFDTSNHPDITFMSTSIEAAGDGAYKMMGDLTIKGMTKPVALSVTMNAAMNHPMTGKPVIGLDASGQILRSDWGLGKFAPNVSDEVQLNISTELVAAE